jgi:glutamate-5-semialdehyde dehydrogenase
LNLESELLPALAAARAAARRLALATTEQKNHVLDRLSGALVGSTQAILAANQRDLAAASTSGERGAFLERLTLSPDRIAAMAEGVAQVAALPDPVGETITHWKRPNGLDISQVRVPIGVIAIVYESRPNVTIDAAALCLKAGDAVVLRGGREALATNALLAQLVRGALTAAALDSDAVMFINNPDREAIRILMKHPDLIDLIIPRGGHALKQALEGSSVPILPHFDGICHTYVDRRVNPRMAVEVCVDAKCSRPAVCNAMETLLVHREIAATFLPAVASRMLAEGVELRGDEAACAILRDARPANLQDWDTEYLDLILAIKVVDSIDEAIGFITRHSSGLADAIVTEDPSAAEKFQREVDSATVYINASTRFTDGYEFGFGAETGISTNRLHARGPMGLRELTTYKYVIRGDGQVRG